MSDNKTTQGVRGPRKWLMLFLFALPGLGAIALYLYSQTK